MKQRTLEPRGRYSIIARSAVALDRKTATADPPVVALVVDSSPESAHQIVTTLGDCRFRVTLADTFGQARERIAESPPALLVTELRLREYNGLQLVLRAKARRPTMAAIVLSGVSDTALLAEAEAMGATFMVSPVDSRELAAAAFRTLLRDVAQDGEGGPIRPPFERRARDRRFVWVPVASERRKGERRRDQATLLAIVAGLAECAH